MNSAKHAIVGAIAAVVPDLMLTTFAWRKEWLPYSHPLLRAHKWLHSWRGLLLAIALGYTTHLLADAITHKEKKW